MERKVETVGNLQALINKKRQLELEIQKIDHQLDKNGVTDILDKVPDTDNVKLIKGYFADHWFKKLSQYLSIRSVMSILNIEDKTKVYDLCASGKLKNMRKHKSSKYQICRNSLRQYMEQKNYSQDRINLIDTASH